MLTHIGDNEFVHLEDCLGIFNFSTLPAALQAEILKKNGMTTNDKIRSVIFTGKGRWLPSPISSDVLAGRSLTESYAGAYVLRNPRGKFFIKPEIALGEQTHE